VKGPQGAIYGRNASAGAFIITTKVPEDEVTGALKASGGQDTTYSLVGDVAGPITDSIRGSVMGEYFTTDGYYKNDYLNRDDIVDNNETWATTGRLIFELGDKTELDTKARYGEVDASSITFNSVFNIPAFAAAPPTGLGPAADEDVNDHSFNFFNNVVHTNDQEALELSAKLDHELEWATFTAWTLFSDIRNELGADGTSAAFGFFNADQPCIDTTSALTGFPLNPPQYIGAVPGFPNSLLGAYTPTACDGTQFQRRDQKDLSFEARLTSNNDGPFQWMGGLYYLDIEREVAVGTGIDRLNPTSYTNGKAFQSPYVTDPSNPTEQLAWDRFDTDVYSVFGQVAYDFTDTFTADLALRWDREERKVHNLVPTPAEGATAQYINPCIPFAPTDATTPINPGLCNGPIPDKSRDFDELQPKISAKWDAFETTTLFASWGVGFRSGGFNNQGSEATVNTFINNLLFNAGGTNGLCDPSTPGCIETGRSAVGITDEYDKETSSAFELGFKTDLPEQNLQLEGATYYNTVDDMQFFEFIVGPFGLLRVVENIDEVRIFGIELAANWQAAEWLDLYIGGNWNDTEIKENNVRPDTIGNDSPYTPEYTANLGAYFSWPAFDDMTFFTNLDIAAVGETWFHVVQDQTRPISFELLPAVNGPFTPGDYSKTQRDAYALANLRLGLEKDQWTAALWASNLFDENYLEEVIPAPEFGGSFIHPGTERRIGADFTWRF
jgi:iron complex outermembrane receptor protein